MALGKALGTLCVVPLILGNLWAEEVASEKVLEPFILDHFHVGENMGGNEASLARELFWVEVPFDGDHLEAVNGLRDDLDQLCYRSGGAFSPEGYFKGNLVKGAFPRPQREVFERVVGHLENTQVFPMDPSDEDRTLALPHALQEIFFAKSSVAHRVLLDRRVDFEGPACDEEGAQRAYRDLVETATFGHFSCENPSDETIKWEVLVQPVALQGKACGKTEGSHTLFVRVIPYEK